MVIDMGLFGLWINIITNFHFAETLIPYHLEAKR